MKRLLAVGVAVSLLQASVAFAAGPLSAATVSAHSSNGAVEKPQAARAVKFVSFAEAARVGVVAAQMPSVLTQQGGGTISQSGMKKSTKTLIFTAVAAAFVGVAYGIDHKVTDVTPSSLGTRED
jgi:hypothetical protein